jgi:hypothetical protein
VFDKLMAFEKIMRPALQGRVFPAQVYDAGDGAGKTRPYTELRGRH